MAIVTFRLISHEPCSDDYQREERCKQGFQQAVCSVHATKHCFLCGTSSISTSIYISSGRTLKATPMISAFRLDVDNRLLQEDNLFVKVKRKLSLNNAEKLHLGDIAERRSIGVLTCNEMFTLQSRVLIFFRENHKIFLFKTHQCATAH